jgi:hypothetical protein
MWMSLIKVALEPVHDLCKVIKKPVLAIYGVAKPAQASSLGLGFAPCISSQPDETDLAPRS